MSRVQVISKASAKVSTMGGASSPDEAFCDAMTLSYDGANLRVLWIPAGTVDEWEASQSDRSQIAVNSQ